MVGTLPRPGNGPAVAVTEQVDLEAFWDTAVDANIRTLQRLRDDEHAAELHSACTQDAELGRMTPPTAVTAAQCQECILSPRFGILQCKRRDSQDLLVPFALCVRNKGGWHAEDSPNR